MDFIVENKDLEHERTEFVGKYITTLSNILDIIPSPVVDLLQTISRDMFKTLVDTEERLRREIREEIKADIRKEVEAELEFKARKKEEEEKNRPAHVWNKHHKEKMRTSGKLYEVYKVIQEHPEGIESYNIAKFIDGMDDTLARSYASQLKYRDFVESSGGRPCVYYPLGKQVEELTKNVGKVNYMR